MAERSARARFAPKPGPPQICFSQVGHIQVGLLKTGRARFALRRLAPKRLALKIGASLAPRRLTPARTHPRKLHAREVGFNQVSPEKICPLSFPAFRFNPVSVGGQNFRQLLRLQNPKPHSIGPRDPELAEVPIHFRSSRPESGGINGVLRSVYTLLLRISIRTSCNMIQGSGLLGLTVGGR